jgi:dihydroxy-acid dehydratase
MTHPLKHRSSRLTDGPDRAPARAMMKAVGFGNDDLARPLVGVAHCWIEVMPCNFNHRRLAEQGKAGIRAAGGTPIEYNTMGVTLTLMMDSLSVFTQRNHLARQCNCLFVCLDE